ncbi:MAG: pilus assembly protein PilP [bacterium]|nr:pilus assembly protein PilP [bacterium]
MNVYKHQNNVLMFLFLSLAIAGGSVEALSQTPATEVAPARKKIDIAVPETIKSRLYKEDYFYDPAGKKDPFFPAVVDEKNISLSDEDKLEGVDAGPPPTPLEMYELSQLKLVAIMKFGDRDVAMVQDPEGKGHTLYIGTLIGKNKGMVLRMEEGKVLIEEKYRKSGNTISEIKMLFIHAGEEN